MADPKRKSDKHQLKLPFSPTVLGVVNGKNQQDLMIYPFFSLSKKRRTKPISYSDERTFIEVDSPERLGIATIFDADILVYVCSQLMEAVNRGLPTSRVIRSSMYDIMKFLGRSTSGKDYRQLKASLDRLQATSILTNIRNDDVTRRDRFNWITSWRAVEDTKTGRPIAIEFELCKWLYEGIVEKKLVLKIDPQYFRLQSGYQRFLYNAARKMCGNKTSWRISLRKLFEMSGSTDKFSHFRRGIISAIDTHSIPGYTFQLTKNEKQPNKYMLHIGNKADGLEELIEKMNDTETLAQSI